MTTPPRLFTRARGSIRFAVVVLTVRALLGGVAALAIGSVVSAAASGGATGGAIVVLGGALAARAAISALGPGIAASIAGSVESDVRRRLLHAVVATGPHAGRRTGDLVAKATEGVDAVGSLAGTFLPSLIGGITIPLGLLALMATIDVPTALILLVLVPLVPGLLRLLERRFALVSNRYRETADGLAARFLDGIQGLGTLKSLGRSGDYGEHLAADAERLRAETMALLRVNQLALLAVDGLFTLGTVVSAAALAAWRLEAGAIDVGGAIAIVVLGVMLIEPLSAIGRFFYVGAIGRAAAGQIREVLAAAPPPAPPVAPVAVGEILLDEVSHRYDDGTLALDQITLRVRPGERVALVGPSGAGKTTLAHVILGITRPTQGVVAVGGRAALVPQRPFLFHGSVADNLRLARPDATDEEIWAALTAADLADLVRDRAEGLATPVGERGLQLSGGEAQRLAIARALLVDAAIVIFDEPTSNVDVESEARIRSALDRVMAGRTSLVIAHRRSTIAGSDRVVRLAHGRLEVSP